MRMADEILKMLCEADDLDITQKLGLMLKGAAYFDVAEVDDTYVVKIRVFGSNLSIITFKKDFSDVTVKTPDNLDLKTFLAEVKKRIGGK